MVGKFSKDVKKACWAKALALAGRDPARGRADAAGTPVIKKLKGANGLCGFQYDHINPNCGPELWNCQILQGQTNNRKSNHLVNAKELDGLTPNIKLNGRDLDLVEMAAYGNLKNEKGELLCVCISKNQETNLTRKQVKAPPCENPGCLAEERCRNVELLFREFFIAKGGSTPKDGLKILSQISEMFNQTKIDKESFPPNTPLPPIAPGKIPKPPARP